MAKLPAHKVRRKPGFFHPVIARARRDGWSVERQCAFLAQLYVTGSVAAAARAVGMARQSAHCLRGRPGAESFARAWDRVLAHPGTGHCRSLREDFRKVTDPTLWQRVEIGLVKPVIHRGRMTAIARKADDSAVLRLMRRGEARCARVGPEWL